jgi:hypothetical protein
MNLSRTKAHPSIALLTGVMGGTGSSASRADMKLPDTSRKRSVEISDST